MAYNTGNVFDAIGGAFFGDGSDGNLVFDNVTTVLGISPASGIYTLNRDIFAQDMTVSSCSVFTNGYRVYVRGKLTISSGASIQCNGKDAVGGGAGLSYTNAGTLWVSGIDGRAGVAANGSAQVGINAGPLTGSCIGGTGGRGGGITGAAGGTGSTQTSNNNFSYGNVILLTTGKAFIGSYTHINGGGGGGSGAISGASGFSGGGGGGGGVVLICAYTLDNLGTISANGGKGGDATGSPSAAGGGGGGNGGLVLVSYRSLANLGTITAAAGLAGAGVSETLAASAGAVGRVVTTRI